MKKFFEGSLWFVYGAVGLVGLELIDRGNSTVQLIGGALLVLDVILLVLISRKRPQK